jgi:hypothetical protein
VPLPAPIKIGQGSIKPPDKFFYQGSVDLETCGTGCPDLDLQLNGIDFWESKEGMLITLNARFHLLDVLIYLFYHHCCTISNLFFLF